MDNLAVVNEIVKLADLFRKVRGRYAKAKGVNPIMSYLPKKEPWKGKHFKTFMKFYKMTKEIENFDTIKYIEAQFETVKRRDVYPSDLTSEYGIKRYFQYLKYEKKYGIAKPNHIDIGKIIEREKQFLAMYETNNGIDNAWEHYVIYNKEKVPAPIELMLKNQITHQYLLSEFPETTLKWSLFCRDKGWMTPERYKIIYVDSERNKVNPDDDLFGV